MRPTDADLLLDELEDDDEHCWCGRATQVCAEAGGCRWTRELAEARRQERAKVAEEIARTATTVEREYAEADREGREWRARYLQGVLYGLTRAGEITRGGQQ